MKTVLKKITAPLAIAAALFGCGKQSTLVDCQFENGVPQNIKLYQSAKISSDKNDVISGKSSLVCDASGKKYAVAFEISTDKFNVFEIDFDYKVLSSVKKRSPSVEFYSEDENGKSKFITSGADNRFIVGEGNVEHSKNVFHSRAGKTAKIKIVARTDSKIAFDNLKVRASNVSAKGDWSVPFTAVLDSCRSTPFHPYYLRPDSKYLEMSREEFFPFIDKYGQFKHRDWKNKIHSDSDFKKRIDDESRWLAKNPPIADRDEFFGFVDPNLKFEAKGRFYAKKINGKWFFITPKGNIFWGLGMCGLGYHQRFAKNTDEPSPKIYPSVLTPIEWRENFYDDVSDPRYAGYVAPFKRAYFVDKNRKAKAFDFYARNIELKYGKGVPMKISTLQKRTASFGINLGGHLSDAPALKAANIPYTVTVYSYGIKPIDGDFKLHGWWQTPPDWFDPNFEKNLRPLLQKRSDIVKSPYCIGVFIDGELPWQGEPYLLARGALSCKASQPAKIAFGNMLQKKYSDISNLNTAWNSSFKSWDNFLSDTKFSPKTDSGKADMLAFEELYTRQYFSTCRKLIKEIDPNMMYLGCSFGMSGRAWEFAAKISSEYCDAISCNTYRFSIDGLSLPQGSADKPILIGEWHFIPQDAGTFGITMIPSGSRLEQCKMVNRFLDSALRNPNIVGVDWFEWVDIPTTGRFDKADSGDGFIDIADTPYYPLVETFRKFSSNMYTNRLSSQTSSAPSSTDDRNWK